MGWFKEAFNKVHDATKWIDPIGHYSLDLAHDTSTDLVHETSDALVKAADKIGVDSSFPQFWADKSQKDKDDMARWAENTIASAALIYGAGAAGGAAGGSGGSTAGTVGNVVKGAGAIGGLTGAGQGGEVEEQDLDNDGFPDPAEYDDSNIDITSDDKGNVIVTEKDGTTKVYPPGTQVNTSNGSIMDAAGKVIDFVKPYVGAVTDLISGAYGSGALGNVLTALLDNKQLEENKELLKKLQTAGVDTMSALANEIGSMPEADLMALAKSNPGMLPMLQQVKTEYNKINVDPYSMNSAKESLNQLKNVSTAGYGPIERAAAAKVLGEMSNRNMAQQEAIKTDLASRGQYGSGQELQARMLSAQANANLASQQGLDIESQAAQRALQAIRDKGTLGAQLDQQEFAQQAEKAKAQDVINKFNTDMAGSVNKANLEQQNAQQKIALDARQQEYQNMLDKQKARAAVAAQGAGNATNMFGQTQKLVAGGIESRNEAIGNIFKPAAPAAGGTTAGTTTGQAASGGSSVNKNLDTVNKGVTTAKNVYDLYQLFSDEKVKKDKKEMSDDDICSILDELVPMSFKYKDSVLKKGAPKGQVIGVMAQQVEKTPAADMVGMDKDGVKTLDAQKAISLALASLGSLHSRLKKVEK